MTTVAYRARFGNDNTPEVALRDHVGRVHFADDATRTWRELVDVDSPRLTLCGRIDLAEAQRLADGNVYAWIERRNTEHAKAA
jgi:hypothetical protein